MTKHKQIGSISNYFDHVKVAAIKLTSDLKVGDVIKIKGGEVDFDQPVESIQIHKDQVESAKASDEIGIKVKEKVRKGYVVFKVTSEE